LQLFEGAAVRPVFNADGRRPLVTVATRLVQAAVGGVADAQFDGLGGEWLQGKVEVVVAGQASAAVGAVPMRFDALCATDKVAQRRYRQE